MENAVINEYISNKIKVSSLILIVMVIYLHSYNIKDDNGFFFTTNSLISSLNIYIQNMISQGITRVAVPLFFIISGFLFFKESKFDFILYKKKTSSRFYTLLVPYIFWSSFVILIYFILQSIPGTSQYFNNTHISELTIYELLEKILFNPVNYPLWFLRDLIYLVVISPFLYFFLKKIPHITIGVMLIIWFFGLSLDGIEVGFYKASPFLFFSIGGYIAIYRKDLLSIKVTNKIFIISLLLYLLLLLYKTYSLTFEPEPSYYYLLHNFLIILGIFIFWTLLDRIKFNILLPFSQYTFLFYVFHEPMNTIIKKGTYSILGKTELVSVFLYLFTPITIMLVLIFTFHILNKLIPNVFSKVLGNRVT